jgi:hypothetical protein
MTEEVEGVTESDATELAEDVSAFFTFIFPKWSGEKKIPLEDIIRPIGIGLGSVLSQAEELGGTSENAADFISQFIHEGYRSDKFYSLEQSLKSEIEDE